MNQYHQRENPPSYESVIQQDNQNKSQSTVDTIGVMSSSVPSSIPIAPSAPPADVTPRTYGSITEVITVQPANPNIILVDACPICRIGLLEPAYTCFGVCLAIFFFPLGLLCCLACKDRRCSNCGAVI